MATFNKFYSFVEAAMKKVHNLESDTLKVALTNTAPVATNTQLSNITEISYTNCSSRTPVIASAVQTSGTFRLILNDLLLTATGGTVGPFRYVVIYNDTATNDELIGWYDYGSSITLNDGETYNLDFDGVNGVVVLS